MKSTKPRKQRHMLYNAPLHKKHRMMSAHLAENLLLKYDRRSLPVVKGDTVKIMRGNFRGHEDKISKVNLIDQTVEIEGVTLTTAKGTKIAKPIHASTLLITKLNVTDKWRRKKLESGLSETTKKEIEKEAEEQLKNLEAEKKAKEEAAKAEEQAKEETKEEPSTEEPTEETPPESREPEVQQEAKEPVLTEETPKETSEKKTETPPKDKQAAAKKTPSKKTPKKKKEEGEK
jgi:large subunit ribosomal protein L24